MNNFKHISLFVIGIVLLSTAAIADTTDDTEFVDATLTLENVVPEIIAVYPGGIDGVWDPAKGDTTLVTIVFTAYDANGINDLAHASAQVVVDNVGSKTNNTCTYEGIDSTSVNYTCTFTMQYHDNYGDWDINASVEDNSGALTYNDTESFRYSKLAAFELQNTPINFSTLTLNTTDNPNENNPLTIENKGNLPLNMNITGANLVGVSDSDYVIEIGNVTVSNGVSNITLTIAPQTHNPAGTAIAKQGSGNLNFWVNIPETGLIPQQYNATWTITGYE